MSKTFSIKIITPERVAFDGNVVSVSCPGAEGRFQILLNHAAFLSTLKIGELDIVDETGNVVRYAMSGGVSQVLKNKMLVLADTTERADEIDVIRAQHARERAERRLSKQEDGINIERARASLFRALNRLKVAQAS